MTVHASVRRGCRSYASLVAHPFSVLLAVLSALAAGATQANADILVIKNGDRLTGEVKSLDRGVLKFDTAATETIEIFWTHVAELISQQHFQVTLDDGRHYLGSLLKSEEPQALSLSTGSGVFGLATGSVVRMTPIESRILNQIDMSTSIGYSIAKANDVEQTTVGYDFGYRTDEQLMLLDLDFTQSASEDAPKSIRSNAHLSYRRFIDARLWDPIGLGVVERNDELGLDRRVTLGGGMSRWIMDTASNRMSFMGGLVLARENEEDAEESDTSIEAAIGVELDWFRHDDPELNVSMALTLYERLSDSSRTRANLDADLRWELISDFFLGFSFYYSLNTEPTGSTASSTDYGVVTSLGWSF